ncbi:hypothetical protein [Desulfoscipio geothermicus]|uniref:Vitamin K epoxide reductase family protein n=1 Tax=Desulfoscipio geothermicus DSM 3669 TaxID=1121426 RepID=A0A1I6EL73_9FIRM|nr:hypothetical protein [Desulfoscipio geothermicus]SFR18268.1 hypothetical protein SAMN05660706_1553 [Desulfoscipio geothermicus DSM 3669]
MLKVAFLPKVVVKSNFNKIVLLFSLFNAFLLSYMALEKNTGCSLCQRVPFLPVTDVTIAVTGAITSLALAILMFFFNRLALLNYSALILSFIAASFSLFLITSQVLINKELCYPCLVTSIIFYIIFFVLFFDLVLKTVWTKYVLKQYN